MSPADEANARDIRRIFASQAADEYAPLSAREFAGAVASIMGLRQITPEQASTIACAVSFAIGRSPWAESERATVAMEQLRDASETLMVQEVFHA